MITFLLTDVEGSTRRWEEDPVAMAAALQEHDAIVDAVVSAHHGSVIKTKGEGDSTFSVFDEPTDAIAAAVDAQRRLHDESELRVRMAIHTGPAEARGGDYYGPTVNRCARLRGVAHGEQIVISNVVAQLVQPRLPDDVTLLDLGIHRLRDLVEPEHVYQPCHPALPRDFPPLASLGVRRDNLRPALTTFVGRDNDINQLVELVTTHPLVTLVGPGGAGKTRLAIEVARRVRDRFPDGVWVVELAAVEDPAHVDAAIAATLEVRDQPGASLREAIRRELERRSLLLVLDNCEHVITEAADIAELVLRSPSGTAALATSRQALQLRGEQVWPITALGIDDEAMELFIERALRVDPRLDLDATGRDAVARICRAVDGLPLGIELAAARLDMLTPTQIADRIDRNVGDDDRYAVLSSATRNVDPRQRTLSNTIAWSYDLLDRDERDVFAALAVFPGSFDLGAAAAVAGSRRLDTVASLVAKSLLSRVDERYVMLETIRAYAADQLAASGRAGEIHDRAVDWALDVTAGGDVESLDLELHNLLAALDWATARRPTDAVRLAVRLSPLWHRRGQWSEARARLRQLIERVGADQPAARALALDAAAGFAFGQDDVVEARVLAEECIALCETIGDDRTRGRAHTTLGGLAHQAGDIADARAHYEAALSLAKAGGDEHSTVSAMAKLAIIEHTVGDLDAAEAIHADVIARARAFGDDGLLAEVLTNAAVTAESRGELDRALAMAEEGLAIARARNFGTDAAFFLVTIGQIATHLGDVDRARASLAEALEVFRDAGDRAQTANTLFVTGELSLQEQRFDDARKALGESLEIFHELKHGVGEAVVRLSLGLVNLRTGDDDAAVRCARESLDVLHRMNNREAVAELLDLYAAIAFRRGEGEAAARFVTGADALRAAIGARRTASRSVDADAVLAAVPTIGALDPDDVVAAALDYR